MKTTVNPPRPNRLAMASVVFGLFFAGCQSAINTAGTSKGSVLAEANEATVVTRPAPGQTHRTLPVLFIVGDSTVHNSATGLLGWGDVIGQYFDPAKIIVENHAKPGRSSRTFQTQGWWAQVLAAARPGDFVLIQMGHNDGGPLDDTNRARGSIPGIGDETRDIYNPIQHERELVHTYGWYLRRYIAGARARGMTPVICSPVPRLPRQIPPAGAVDRYVAWSAQVAADQKVFFINLNQIILSHYAGLTTSEIKTNFYTPKDDTHFSPAGAQLNAACVIEGLRELTNCPLEDFLLDKPKPPVSN